MSITTTTFSADATNTLVGTLNKNRAAESTEGVRVDAFGNFGGGTVTFSYSPDGGTTKIPVKSSVGGAAISFSSAEGFVWTSTIYNGASAILLYATLSGATSPDLTIKVSNPYEV